MIESDPHTRPDARRSVMRSAVVWTPIFIASSALAVAFALIALDDSPGAWISFAIAALVALLSGVSALGALRDLYTVPIETKGKIERKWRKSDILVFRGHYVMVRKRVFRIPRELYDAMPEAGASIAIQHFPHSNAIVAWAAVSAAEADDAGDRAAERAELTTADLEAGPQVRIKPEPAERVEPPRFDVTGQPPSETPTTVEPPSFGRDSDTLAEDDRE